MFMESQRHDESADFTAQTSLISQAIALADAEYLNLPSSRVSGDHYLWPLKCAVEFQRPAALMLLLKRMPGVSIDLCHPDHALAEPLRLSMTPASWKKDTPEAKEIQQLLTTAEQLTREYFSELPTHLEKHLVATLPAEITRLVIDYASRMPLSSIFNI
jgi:hypothetical protein